MRRRRAVPPVVVLLAQLYSDLALDPTCEAVETCCECGEQSSASLGGLAGWTVVQRATLRYCCPECARVLGVSPRSSAPAPSCR
jgi:hypothetical protein